LEQLDEFFNDSITGLGKINDPAFLITRPAATTKDTEMNERYIVITPAKNEEKMIEHTLKSVCHQTLKPLRWIIVDDGSNDDTASIVDKYREKYPWITLIKNDTYDEERSGGPKVVRAFYRGYDTIADDDYDFIVKMDADLTLPDNYFETVSRCFNNNSKVGICGGYCVNEKDGKLVKEKTAEFHVRGAFKAYRKECFADIGGIKQVWDWDGLDQMMAMYSGWEVEVLPLAVVHHRETSGEYNLIRHSFRSGKEYYKMGYGFLLAVLKSVSIMPKKPFLLRGAVFFIGFTSAFLNNSTKIVDNDLAGFIRKFQYDRILKRFRCTT